MRPCLLLFSLFASAATLAGCDRQQPSKVVRENLTILATVYPLADVAREIGGPYVQVQWIVESGQSLAGVRTDADLRSRLRSADLVLAGGVSEPWAVEGFDDPFQSRRIVRLDLLPAARTGSTGLLWLDPLIMKDFAREVCSRLLVVRPEDEAFFRGRTDDFIVRLEALVQPYRDKLVAARNRQVLVLGTDFNALLQRFSLEPVLAVEALPTQLSDSQFASLKRASQEHHNAALLVSADTPAVVVRELEQRCGLRVVLIDSLGSSAGEGRNSYFEVLKYDLEQLVAAASEG